MYLLVLTVIVSSASKVRVLETFQMGIATATPGHQGLRHY